MSERIKALPDEDRVYVHISDEGPIFGIYVKSSGKAAPENVALGLKAAIEAETADLRAELTELRTVNAELRKALLHIANDFMSPEDIRDETDEEDEVLDYEEYLEMAYENMQQVARTALKRHRGEKEDD